MYSINKIDNSRKPPLTSSRMLDQLRERLRYMHYSLQTEKSYAYWVRWYIRWHGVRHPKDMGGKEVEALLSMLANERKVSASTRHQALMLMSGVTGLLARLIYGTGMRLREALSLRIKDVECGFWPESHYRQGWHRREFPSRSASIPYAIALPRTCCNEERI